MPVYKATISVIMSNAIFFAKKSVSPNADDPKGEIKYIFFD